MSWLRIRELVRKEFIVLFRDKHNRPILIIAPVIQILVFGYVVNYDIRKIDVAVMDQARTPESRSLIRAIDGNKIFTIIGYTETRTEFENLLLHGKVDLGIKISPNMSSRIGKGQTAPIQILVDGSMSNMAAVRIAYLMNIINEFNKKTIKIIHPRRMEYGHIDARIRTWYNPNSYSQHFFVPGIVAFVVMLMSLLLTSIAIIREKEAGTMEQLMVTPIKPFELILGKTIPYIIIALSQMGIILLIAKFWFAIPIAGSMGLLFFAACIFLMSTLGIGLFISTVSATQQQAMMTTFFFILPILMLSGFIFPIDNMPVIVQWLTYLNPLRYFLVITRGIFLKGVGFHVLWHQFLAMTILGVVLFAGAIVRFRKRLD